MVRLFRQGKEIFRCETDDVIEAVCQAIKQIVNKSPTGEEDIIQGLKLGGVEVMKGGK